MSRGTYPCALWRMRLRAAGAVPLGRNPRMRELQRKRDVISWWILSSGVDSRAPLCDSASAAPMRRFRCCPASSRAPAAEVASRQASTCSLLSIQCLIVLQKRLWWLRCLPWPNRSASLDISESIPSRGRGRFGGVEAASARLPTDVPSGRFRSECGPLMPQSAPRWPRGQTAMRVTKPKDEDGEWGLSR